MIDLPLTICILCGVFYGTVWVLNKDLIWQTPQRDYMTYEEWFAANRPKGLWYGPIICALVWPQNHQKISLDPISDFLIERIFATVAAIAIGFALGKWVRFQSFSQ